jgi:6-phosphogluconolactonase
MAEDARPIAVYVSSAGTREIIHFAFDPVTSALRSIGATPVPGPDGPSPTSMPMALSPDRKRLYVAVRSAPFPVTSFAIDGASGLLKALATAELPDAMAYLSTDRSGRYLFGASYVDAKLSVSVVDGEGKIVGPSIQVIETPPKAHCVLADHTNRWVFATSLGGDVILQMRFDAVSGTLSPNAPPALPARRGCGPRHIALHPAGDYLYVVNELDATITGYAIDLDRGTLEERQLVAMLDADATSQPSAADIHLTPDGRFLYASERATHRLVAFEVNPQSGRLTRLGAFRTEPSPRGFAISPCGRFLLAAGQVSDRVAIHALDPRDGRLTVIGHHAAGSNPNWVEFVALT